MGIIVGKDTRLVVQGITGREGSFHALNNKTYGTQVVAGVTPGKAGHDVDGIPVYNTVQDAVIEQQANTAMIFVPSRGGISHNPAEHTDDDQLVSGANVLLRSMLDVAALDF